MQRLRSTIQSYLVSYPGPGQSREALAEDLKKVSRTNERYLNICVGMLIVLFLVSLVLILICRGQPAYLAAVSAFTGVSVFGCVQKMGELWREKSSTDIVLAMVAFYSDDEFNRFLVGFFDRVFPAPQKAPPEKTLNPSVVS